MAENKFVSYIFSRIKGEDYRGIHLSQHNRLPFDKVLDILTEINRISGKNRFKIHIGDWKGDKQKGCENYYKIVDNLRES